MDEINKLLEAKNEFSYIYFLLSLFLTVIYSFIVRYCYENYGNALGSKIFISRIIVFLAITTFLVISVVKQSLALSLGLVGALSIIRFRTPIKDPEDLIYLFVSLAIGIGMAAGQILITTICFTVIVILIFMRRNKTFKNETDYNLILSIKNKVNIENEIINIIKSDIKKFKLIRYDLENDECIFYFNILTENHDEIFSLKNNLVKKINITNFQFIESKDLTI